MADDMKRSTCVCSYGAFNPPTSTHLDIFDRLQNTAQNIDDADALVFVIDDPESTLDWSDTVRLIEQVHDINICGESSIQDIVQAFEWIHSRGYSSVVCLVDSSQVSQLQEGLDAYNEDGTLFKFESIRVISIGSPVLSTELRDNTSGKQAADAVVEEDFTKFKAALGPRIGSTVAARTYNILKSKLEGIV